MFMATFLMWLSRMSIPVFFSLLLFPLSLFLLIIHLLYVLYPSQPPSSYLHIPTRNFYKCTYDDMSAHVQNEVSSTVIPRTDVWQAYFIFESILQQAIDRFVSLEKRMHQWPECILHTNVYYAKFTAWMH
eukprot:GHVN01025671.1.p1 GENE.GHVN01025671.1~~GHVN01025671.1.p1  ORF type:complete len:130 (+),score=8.81 GHVN01025671.1:372-761(+)